MYIKRLEIVGFKSFPERTLVPLSPGLSAVVGPNGCGKSNIIDAIRWVMGEQSPKMLRGRNMEDVLFNGSAGRPPSALAEVTLTLARDHDVEGRYSPAETSVTRRLYRSGDSEYLINKISCRLKDVVHFFTDHGVGTRAYGIIEQGRVGWLVDARPEERRGLIDEAAGITRYKRQKKEAERKIESTEVNLLNISVIKAETKKQLDQITRAAAKAARYKILKEELRELDLGLAARSLSSSRQKHAEINLSQEQNRRLLTSLLVEASQNDQIMAEIKAEVTRIDHSLKEKTEAWHQLTGARDGALKEQEFCGHNIKQTEERRVQVLNELARLASERRRQLEEEARLNEELTTLKHEDGQARTGAERLTESWQSSKSALETANIEYDKWETVRSTAERQASALLAELSGRESLLKHHQQQLAILGEQALKLEEEEKQARTRLENLTLEKAEQTRTLEEARQEASFLAEEVRMREKSRVDVFGKVTSLEARLAALTARLEALREVKDNFGWYPQGVKTLMANPELRAAGLRGPLAEFLEIPDGYEDAAEAALGERLAWLLVENRAAALAALDFMDLHNLGRCSFLYQNPKDPSDLSRSLLGDYCLMEDFGSNSIMKEEEEVVLTRSGRYLGSGVVAGGRPTPDEAEGKVDTGLLARLKEVEGLSQEENRLSHRLTQYREELESAREAEEVAREMALVAESALRNLNQILVETDKSLALAASDFNRLESRGQTLLVDLGELRQNAQKLSESLAEGRLQKEITEDQVASTALKVAEAKENCKELAEIVEETRTKAENARTRAAAAAERLSRADNDLRRVTEWLAGVEDNLEAKEEQASDLAKNLEELNAQARELELQVASFPERLQILEQDLVGTREQLEAQRLQQENKETGAKEVRRRREDINSFLATQETELMATNFSIEKVEEDLRRDWEVIMDDLQVPEIVSPSSPEILPSFQETEALASEEAGNEVLDLEGAETEALNAEPDSDNPENYIDPPETPFPVLSILDIKEWAEHPLPPNAGRQRDHLKSKINALGEVSLGAIDQEAGLRAEYEHYQTQHDDLTRAIEDLKTSIARLNHTCRLRFAETFQAGDAKFREIFPILFEGGQGWLSLTQEDDPLESGVEINVHPSGKKMLVMSLLSGGEKALTALALIFALYLIKPSPFCLLDETDAPLDEANLDRFNRLLKQLSQTSQIIMVTHNKRSMQISQTLYGVTMETPGISKLVSVNLAATEALTTHA